MDRCHVKVCQAFLVPINDAVLRGQCHRSRGAEGPQRCGVGNPLPKLYGREIPASPEDVKDLLGTCSTKNALHEMLAQGSVLQGTAPRRSAGWEWWAGGRDLKKLLKNHME